MSSSKRLLKPMSGDNLDNTICQQMSSLVELLVTSGKSALNPEVMKKFKKLCRISDDYVRYTHDLLMIELVQDHSEIRLSALQMVDELFNRSHAFRERILADFQTFMELTLDCEHNCPLPPPKQAASRLKEEAVKCIQQWYDKFGEAYKKLSLGHQYLKTCKKVNFDEVLARLETERLQREETQRKLEEARLMKLEQVKNEMNDLTPDIELCLREIENCIQLLMPHPDTFFIPEPETTDLTTEPLNKTDNLTGAIGKSENKGKLKTDSVSQSDSNDVVLEQGRCDKCKTSQACEDGVDDRIKTSGTSDQLKDIIGIACSCDNLSNSVNVDNGNGKRENLEQTLIKNDAISSENLSNNSGNSVKTDKFQNSVTESSDKGADCDGNNDVDDDDDNDDEDDDDFQEVGAHAELRQAYGLGSRDYQISVTIGGDDRLKENEDNTDIIQSLKDQYRLVKNKYLGVIKKWIKTMESNKASKADLESGNGLKTRLEEALKKCVELEILANPDKHTDDSDSEEDFEEVVEKEGYEEDVPEHLRLQELEKPSTSKQSSSKSKSNSKRPSNTKSSSSSSKRLKSLASKAIASQQGSSFDQALNEIDRDVQSEKLKSHSKSPSAIKSKEQHKTSLKKSHSSTSPSSAAKPERTSLVKSASVTSPDKGKATQSYWSLNCRLQEEDIKDPTSWKANVSRMKEKAPSTSSAADIKITEEPDDTDLFTPDTSLNEDNQKTDKNSKALLETSPKNQDNTEKIPNKNDLLEKAPLVSFGKDLEHWENPDQIEAPLEVNYEAGRFWISNETTDKDQKQKVAAMTMRSMSYTGEFQPVKWKCRAPLPSGKLCERMDREKCPFHGKIIGRDEAGQPTDPADIVALMKSEPADDTGTAEDENESSGTESPANEITTKLKGGKGKGKGKGKKKKPKWGFPGLTDTTQTKDMCRHRLESKVFKKATMKRVNADLDRMDFKRVRDKFGNQFNYSLH